MEERLKESEELHRFIVNSSPDLVYMLDRNGCFEFLNDRFETLLGYQKEELKGRHYSELIFEDDLDAARNLFNERRTGDRATRNVELRMRSRRVRSADRAFQTQTVWMDLTAQGRYSDPTSAPERTSSARTALRATFPSAKKQSRSSTFRPITTC